ncbi:MAG: hypothetical protein ACT4OF_14160 [Caulobacteraceae bacterium]
MNKPDLDTVTSRRRQIASELAGLEKMRLEIEAEDQDLVVAERALKRLAALSVADAPVSSRNGGRA